MSERLATARGRLGLRVPLLALLTAALAWYLGTDVWHALLIGIALLTVAGAATAASLFEVRNIRWRGEGSQRGKGSRNDVDVLAWSLRGSYGRVGISAIGRARAIARTRLAARGLDLNEPAHRERIEQLIGTSAYTILSGSRRRPPRFGQLMACLDALDHLTEDRPTRPIAGSTR